MAQVFTKTLLSLLALAGSSVAGAEAASNSSSSIEAVGIPAGFAELTRPRETLVDLYFGGRKVGEARISTRPGFVRFHNPDEVLALVPNAKVAPELVGALARELPANASRVCPEGMIRGCGVLSPELVGVIFNEDQFRLDLFLNPGWLHLSGLDDDVYLSTPIAPLSLTSSMGLALSGSSDASSVYNLQNRSIVAFRNARIRTDTSYASKLGFVVDSLVAEVDRPDLRYSAGLFWAPGLDLTGQRRILGVGLGTQFDTRADRDLIRGTPLILFLAQPARVEVLIDGRLVGSGVYEAGNNVIDTSTLPNGSYSILLRIHESGTVREERRFFVKNAQIAPVGQPVYFAYVGMLANTRTGRPVSVSKDLFYQFGTARRLSEALAVDVALIGTTKKPLFEVGAWLMTRFGRMRAAGLASPTGDRGALLQLMSAQTGRLSFNFDLRRISSRDNKPLIPLSTYVDTFRSTPLPDEQLGEGSYTQASGSVGYRIGPAYVALIGSLRKDKGRPADYSIGPNVSWPIVNRNGLQLTLQADAQLTRTTTAGFVGFRMLFNSGALSVSSTGGHRAVSSTSGSSARRSRGVGGVTGHYSYHDDDLTQLSLAGGVERDLESTSAHASGMLYSRFGSARGEIRQTFEGDKRTQYALTVQTGAVLNRDNAVFGGRTLEESALVASIAGEAGDSEFEVLINDQPRGRLKSGGRLPIFLQAYRAYKVRLRPVNAASVWYESSNREFSLYPGNVQHVRWRVEKLFTIFGRAVRSDGKPVADAIVTSRRGLGQSDANGYFQIEVTANELVSFSESQGRSCTIGVGSVEPRNDYAAIGKVLCR